MKNETPMDLDRGGVIFFQAGSMTAQEVANVMYALAIVTYDTAVSIPIYSEKGAKNKNMESDTKTKA